MLKQKSKTPKLIKRVLLLALPVALVFAGLASMVMPRPTALAATNSTINFQARLLTAAGNVVPDGVYNVEFKLYNVASSGTALWTETRTGTDKVTVKNGYLTVNLGSVTAFGGGINWDQDLWLTMNIGGTGSPAWDGEMNPRLKLTSVPYAFRSGAIVSANGSVVLTVDENDVSGKICVQNSANCGFMQGQASDFIQNTTTTQQANLSIQSASPSSVAGVFKGASGQTANILQVQDSAGSALFQVGANTASFTSDVTITGRSTSPALTLKSYGGAGNGDLVLDVQNQNGSSILSLYNGATLALGNVAGGAGMISISNGTYYGQLRTNLIGGTRTYDLPDEEGIVCLQNKVSCGFILNDATFDATLRSLTLAGTGLIDFDTPKSGLSNVKTKISIPAFDPGDYNQIIALGIPELNNGGTDDASTSARVISLFDGRTQPHQPTLAVFDPSENDAIGFSWEGGSATGYIKTLGSSQVGIRTNNNTDVALFSSGGIDLLQNTAVASGKTLTVSGTLRSSTIDAGVSGEVINIGGTNALGINLNEDTSIGSGKNFTAQGDVTFKNVANSATAFRILNTDNLSLFTADTTSGRVYIGSPTDDAVGALLVLDSKNTAGDPVGVNGSMYYNSSTNKFRCYEGGAWKDCIGAAGTGNGTLDSIGSLVTSGTKSANGASISGSQILMQTADQTYAGLVSADDQIFGGNKTFMGDILQKSDSASALTLKDSAGNINLQFSSADNHLKIYDPADTGKYVDIYYSGSTAYFKASAGATQIGNGTGDVNISLTNNTERFNFLHTGTNATSSDVDFQVIRQMSGGANNLQGAILKVEDLSTFTNGTGSSAPDVLYVNQNNTNATGNLIVARQGGTTDKFKVNVSGTVTIAAGQNYTSAGSVGLVAGAGGALTLTGNAASSLTTTSGDMNIQAAGTSTLTLDTAGAGTVALGATASAVNIASSASAHTINIGSGAAAQAITIGSTSSTGSLALRAGTGNISISTTGSISLTAGGNITIGTSDTTGTQFVLDDKTDSSDPASGINGGMYYNSSLGKFRCYEGSSWKDCISPGYREFMICTPGSFGSGVCNTYSNFGAAYTEIPNSLSRTWIDLSSFSEFRIVSLLGATATTADIRLDCDTDSAFGSAVTLGTQDNPPANVNVGAWTTIPAGECRTSGGVYVRAGMLNGNGTEDPSIRYIRLQVR